MRVAFRSLVAVSAVSFASAAPPSVVSTVPATGARFVDPATTEIVVTFDAAMSPTSWSWCGGGENYPRIPEGKAPWFRDERTAVLPVALEPEHFYALGINCPSARGFRSASGEPATVHWLSFTTGSGAGMAQSDPMNAAAWSALLKIVDERYSHAARTGTDWRAAFEENGEWVLAAPSATEWTRRAAEVLAPAKDPHLSFRLADGTVVPTFRRGVRVNANFDAAARAFPGFRQIAEGVFVGRREDGVAYLRVDGWSGDAARAKAVDGALDGMADAAGIVVDVRANGGGDEIAARKVAARFVEAPCVYSRDRFRDPSQPGGWTKMLDRTVEPRADRPAMQARRLVVLQGIACLSSNESFVAMMKCSARTTTIGETTGGSSGNPKPHALPNGVVAIVPSWEDYLADGAPLEGRGIPPDIAVEWRADGRDAVLERALEMAAGR